MYNKYIKRILDFAAALILLVGLSPLFLIIAIIIKLESRGSIVLRQQRYGKGKRPFVCYKFRTMHVTAPSDMPTRKLRNSRKYITPSGKIFRRLGIDELPQIVNILKGEMSFIGPRPVILAEKDLITQRDKYGANDVLPGIGGWAQSNGRDESSISEKARLDGEYAQHLGLKMDISCLWRTAVAIFTSKGFKEGHFGDNEYRQTIERTTKIKNPAKQLYKFVSERGKREKSGKQRNQVVRTINE